MDRRSILFIVGMTAIFFLMNQWFHYGKKGELELTQPKTTVEFVGQKTTPKTLTESELKRLGIVRLFRDVKHKEFITFAVNQNDTFLTLASENTNFPEELYVQNPAQTSNLIERIELRVAPKGPGQPVLYSRFPLSKLSIPWIPDEGEHNVQMIYFEGNSVKRIEGTSYGTKRVVFDAIPDANALLLFDIKNTSSPYAYLDSDQREVSYLNETPGFESYSVLAFPTKEALSAKDDAERFYILENEYFQLVFSNYNGALSEINLPFQSESHPNSVVREIEFGRILQNEYPDYDKFPQFPALQSVEKGKTREVQPSVGGYYPLIRRDIWGRAGDTTVKINPHYYSTAIFEKDRFPVIEEFKVTRFEKDVIEFQLNDGKRKITKTFSLPKDPNEAPYILNLSVNIEGDARKLVMGTGIPEVELISGSFNPTLKYRTRKSLKPKIEQIKTPKTLTDLPYVDADWFCNGNGFFGIIVDPLNRETPGLSVHPISGELVPTRLSIIDATHQKYAAEKYPGYGMQIPIMARPGKTDYRLFLGPFDKGILKQLDQTFSDPSTGYTPDYSAAQSYHGWFAFISQPFAKFLFIIMNLFHSLTGSWGISIILLTVVLRLMLYPLNNWSMRSNAKMQKLAPKIKELQEKYKKDQKRAQMEMMNLYRKEKVNPLGGCFPILIQLPFLFGMFDLLKSSFELRGAPFIPGWIDNLTAPDVLFSWSYPIPFFGNAFHLLPILLGVIMYFQQKVMSAGKAATDQQKQQHSMGNIMTIVFTVMFYHFPSGLNLYWISSMLLGIVQQWLVNKKINPTKG